MKQIVLSLLTATAFISAAHAQASYSCANDLPNPYRLVANWAETPRPFAAVNAVTVDGNNNFWAADRCEQAGCDQPIVVRAVHDADEHYRVQSDARSCRPASRRAQHEPRSP